MKSVGILHWLVSLASAILGAVWYLSWTSGTSSDMGIISGTLGLVSGSIAIHVSLFRWPRPEVIAAIFAIVLSLFALMILLLPEKSDDILSALLLLLNAFLVARLGWLVIHVGRAALR